MTENHMESLIHVLLGILIGVTLVAMLVAFFGCKQKPSELERLYYKMGYAKGFGEALEMAHEDLTTNRTIDQNAREKWFEERMEISLDEIMKDWRDK